MLNRAYSLLTVKAVDVERRLLTGVASTPEPDRMGDVIEPDGVTFKNPLPLLLYHDSHQPVGTVRLDKPTKHGVTFTAQIPEITEPGRLRDRVEEAWQSIKAKLIRGVSIGFRPLNDAMDLMQDTGGIRFRETEILELSLVAIPANHQATILSIKQFDTLPAASGTGRAVVVPTLPGATGSRRTGSQMETIQEQKIALDATRQAKSARLNELVMKPGKTGEVLDDADSQECDEIEGLIKKYDDQLARLDRLEEMNKKVAVPVSGDNPKDASTSRGGHTVSIKSNLPPGTGFTRYAMALAASRGSRFEAIEYAKRWQSSTPEIVDLLKIDTGMLTKAASDAGTTTDATWAAPLVVYNNLAAEFIELLRPKTILGQIPGLRKVPFNVQMPRQTSGSTVNWVGQGKPKPVGELAFDSVTLGMSKAAGIIAMTEELVRSSSPSAEAIVRGDLIAAIAQFLDVRFLDPQYAAVANVSPASITNGATVVDATGVTAAAFRTDVKTAMGTFTGANLSLSGAVWIMTETQALAFSMIQNALGQPEYGGISASGGTLFGLPVITSENIPAEGGSPAGNRIILLKPSEILVADEGGVVIDVSREASVQMNTTPDDPATASTVMVSAWQNNLVFIRAERFLNWLRRRTEAVVVIEGAVYTG